MSLETHSTKNARVYQRAFDHDECRALREADPKRWTYAELGRHFGVSRVAVNRVLDPRLAERMAANAARVNREKREPCKGDCGTLVWRHGSLSQDRTGYCPACYGQLRTAADVRDTELRCRKCGEWKPDDDFTPRPRATRRGRRSHCRDCETAARKAHRKANPEATRTADTNRKRRDLPMSTFIVLCRNGNGWKEHAEVEATTQMAAIEKAATDAGDYVAISAKQVFRVEPVTALKVVRSA